MLFEEEYQKLRAELEKKEQLKRMEDFHFALASCGILTADITFWDEPAMVYQYISIGPDEFQFFRKGDMPTNYVLEKKSFMKLETKIEKILDYNSVNKCLKCNSNLEGLIRADKIFIKQENVLQRRCPICGYTWKEQCADRSTPTQFEGEK